MFKPDSTDGRRLISALESMTNNLLRPVNDEIVKLILQRYATDFVNILCCNDRSRTLLSRYNFALPDFLQPMFNFTQVYVHHFQSSDEDRALHDHPWDFFTFLLSGGYTEHFENEDGKIEKWYRRQYSFLYRPAEFKHRVELTDGPVWTIVFRSARRREWGFHLPDGKFVPWQQYSQEFCEPDPNYHAHAMKTREREGRNG